jgi:hypothetical protein
MQMDLKSWKIWKNVCGGFCRIFSEYPLIFRNFGGNQEKVIVCSHGISTAFVATAIIKDAHAVVTSQMEISLSNSYRQIQTNNFYRIAGFISFEGAFDLEKVLKLEAEKGVEDLSCNSRVFGINFVYKKILPIKCLPYAWFRHIVSTGHL